MAVVLLVLMFMLFCFNLINLLCLNWQLFFPVDSPSKISEETVDDSLTMDGDDLADNSIDDLPGVYDYSYSGGYSGWRECAVGMVLIKSIVVMFLGAVLGRSFW